MFVLRMIGLVVVVDIGCSLGYFFFLSFWPVEFDQVSMCGVQARSK